MNSVQGNLLNMLQAVEAILDKNAPLWSGPPVLAEAVNDFKTHLAVLENATVVQKTGRNTGYTGVIKQNLDAMVSKAFEVATALLSYAEKINDPVMHYDVNFRSVAALVRGKRILTITRCKTILQIAESNLGKLADYQVTAGDIAELKAAIDATTTALNTRKMLVNQSSSATKVLKLYFIATLKALISLDRLLKKLVKDEAFLSSYAALSLVHVYPRRQSAKKTQPAPQTQPATEKQDVPATNKTSSVDAIVMHPAAA